MKVAITGEFRRGKDTLADMIEEQIPSSELLARLAFANALKREVADMVEDYLGSGDPEPLKTSSVYVTRELMSTGWQWWGEFRRRSTTWGSRNYYTRRCRKCAC